MMRVSSGAGDARGGVACGGGKWAEGGATGARRGLKTGRPGVLQEEMWYDASKLGRKGRSYANS